jgi:hypothetical protein
MEVLLLSERFYNPRHEIKIESILNIVLLEAL